MCVTSAGERVLASGSVQLPRFTLLESGSLLISPSHISDAGTYTCMASNSRGIDEASADLVVWGECVCVLKCIDQRLSLYFMMSMFKCVCMFVSYTCAYTDVRSLGSILQHVHASLIHLRIRASSKEQKPPWPAVWRMTPASQSGAAHIHWLQINVNTKRLAFYFYFNDNVTKAMCVGKNINQLHVYFIWRKWHEGHCYVVA